MPPITLKGIVVAPKSDVRIGSWRTGKVPRSDFPIARKAYGLGNAIAWCILGFRALDVEVRVLVIFNPGKGKYEAILGVLGMGGVSVLCSYQYHAGEPGWHCHATCEEAGTLPVGIFRGPWMRRIPKAKHRHRRLDFDIDDRVNAVRFAQDVYGIFAKGDLL